MSSKEDKQDKWMLATSVSLSLLSILYLSLLFPADASTVLSLYIGYVIVTLVVILALFLTLMLYKRQQKLKSKKLDSSMNKKIKIVEQFIWRNRYVLQSQKGKLNQDTVNDNIEAWEEIKTAFSKKYIFPTVSESDISLKIVSELIDKSLRGAAIGGIRPQTYSVNNGSS